MRRDMQLTLTRGPAGEGVFVAFAAQTSVAINSRNASLVEGSS
jgi:hypothetical protein